MQILKNNTLSFYTEDFSLNDTKDPEVLKVLKETLSLHEFPKINDKIHLEEVYLMCLFADDESVQKFSGKFPHLSFKRWHPYVLNVLQEEVSKSLAIKKVLAYFEIDHTEAIAFGDGENDIDMIELVGLGIAMGNGNINLKKLLISLRKNQVKMG